MVSIAPLIVVEDEESDALLLKLAMEEARVPNRLIVLHDGQELMSYLAGEGHYGDRLQFPLPGLLLLDLKMPRIDGFMVLSWLASRGDLRHIPAVVFSASTSEADMKKALALGATDYLTKPSQFRVLVKIVRTMQERWLAGPESPLNGRQPGCKALALDPS